MGNDNICENIFLKNINFIACRREIGMGANHGGAWGLHPPEILLGGLAMDTAPPRKTRF